MVRNPVPYRQNDPFREMDRMLERMQNIMNRSIMRWPDTAWSEEQVMPLALNMVEDDEEIRIEATLPGLTEDDIELRIEGSTLTLSGELGHEEEREGQRWHLYERSYGTFHRSVQLPAEVDADAVEATLERGILAIRLPKEEPSTAKKIAVKARKLLKGEN